MSERDEQLQKAARDLYSQARGNPDRLAMMAAQFQRAAAERHGGTLEVLGIVSARTGQPVVQLEWGGATGQLDVEQARAHALLIVEAAQNAVADAAILEWAKDELELDLDRASALVDALRRYRSDRWGQPDLDIEFERPPPDEA
jgi:hypothetical protein